MSIADLKLKNGETLQLQIDSGDYVIDCGANIGEVTTFFHSHGAYVLAFEPNKYAYEILEERFKNSNRVKCIPKGVSGK